MSRHGRPRYGRWASGTVAGAILATAWLAHDGVGSSGPPTPPASAAAAPAVPARGGSRPAVAALPRAAPTRVSVPALGIDAPLVGIGLDREHRLQPPPLTRPKEAGWYSAGPAPGSAGTAVIVGHVDDPTGPAVFFLLGKVRPGTRIEVARSDGRRAVFSVDAVRLVSKSSFPTDLVYGRRTGPPQLRLITCGGRYRRPGGYASNTVVFAHLAATEREN